MSTSILMLILIVIIEQKKKKQVKTQCQILQGLNICIQLLCLGKVGIYNGSGMVKK